MLFQYLKSIVSIFREEANEKAKKAKNRKLKRYALIGLATVGGGALIGTVNCYAFDCWRWSIEALIVIIKCHALIGLTSVGGGALISKCVCTTAQFSKVCALAVFLMTVFNESVLLPFLTHPYLRFSGERFGSSWSFC